MAQAAVGLAAVGLVLSFWLGLRSGARPGSPGATATLLGTVTGMVGMYLALIQVVLISRIPALEHVLGQDGLLRWHRRVAPWPISLLVAHAVLIVIGYGQSARTGFLHETVVLVLDFPNVLAATVALGVMVAIGIVSLRAIRSRLRRETWWAIHLYMYLALALSFAHVILLGPTFVGHPALQAAWTALWVVTAGVVLGYRVGLPVVRSLRHDLRVVEVHPEGAGAVSVVCEGRRLDRMAVSGGQFFAWRFMVRGMWWQAHPYSLSAGPRAPYVRLTVKQVDDHSRSVAALRPGTRVFVEGPYGAFTTYALGRRRALLIAGGIGVTALRALLEDLPRESSPVVVVRASSPEHLYLRDELAELVRQRRGQLHELVGSRADVVLDAGLFLSLVQDLGQRDAFVCGPPGFVQAAVAALTAAGLPRRAVHAEEFAW
ncbi:MAG: ferredoxin reductase family protein [Acidimicrobiales bacterium]